MSRAWALAPLAFFVYTVWDYTHLGTEDEVLWICNVCNLLLAFGAATRSPIALWTATLWLVIGTPLWIVDEFTVRTFHFHAVFTHIGAAGLGLWLLRGVPRPRHIWAYGIALLFVLQLASRFLTRPALNVNLAFGAYGDLLKIFPDYRVYWALNLVLFSLVLAGVARLVEWVTARKQPAERAAATGPLLAL